MTVHEINHLTYETLRLYFEYNGINIMHYLIKVEKSKGKVGCHLVDLPLAPIFLTPFLIVLGYLQTLVPYWG